MLCFNNNELNLFKLKSLSILAFTSETTYAMTHGAKVFVLSLIVGFAFTNPICDHSCEDKNIEEDSTKKVNEIKNNHLSSSEDCSQENGSSCSASSSEEDNKLQRIVIPVTQSDSAIDYVQPTILTSLPYQRYRNNEEFGPGINSFNEMYPHVHPNILTSYNSRYNVNALPPVQSTYIHGLMPLDEMQRAAYELDVLSPQNTGYLPVVARSSRMLRDTDEEMLAQLQHDAIMNNILPTMSVPFARYAAPAYGQGSGVSAVFPHSGSGCAQPILFTCTPKVIRGVLKPVDTYQPAAYRKDAEVPKTASVKHSDPVKVDLVSKTANTESKRGN